MRASVRHPAGDPTDARTALTLETLPTKGVRAVRDLIERKGIELVAGL